MRDRQPSGPRNPRTENLRTDVAKNTLPEFRLIRPRAIRYTARMNSTALASSDLSLATGRFRITPLPLAFAHRVRTTLHDDFGRRVTVSVALGGEPLRDEHRRATPGERIILCSYQSVPLPSMFAEIGPIFISAEPSVQIGLWEDELPRGYFPRAFAVRVHDIQHNIIESAICEPTAASGKISEFLSRQEAAYVQARFAGNGCFACRFDRR